MHIALVLDSVLGGENEFGLAKLWGLEMLVIMPGGRERTEPELRQLAKAAGLKVNRLLTLQGSHLRGAELLEIQS